jgi:NADPH:quinone reductase-like Zn-dependent oxidoreductase
MATGTTASLERLAELLRTASLRVHVQESFGLEQAGEALESLTKTHTRGKLAIAMA